MLDYIKAHDFTSFSRNLEKSKPLNSTNLTIWLSEAVKSGLEDFVKLLLNSGANPDEINNDNLWNPIHLAIEFEHVHILEILIEAGANFEYKDQSGCSPLYHAVDMEADSAHQMDKEPVPQMSKILLDAGASPLICNSSGVSVVELAKKYKYYSFLRLIKDQGKVK